MRPLDRNTFDELAAQDPAWVVEHRERAWAAYEKLPMPTSKEEEWRYVDLDFDLSDFGLVDSPGEPLDEADALLADLGTPSARVRIVDGAAVTVTTDALPDGVVVTSLRDAFVAHEAEVRGAFGQGIPVDLDRFSAAHHAFVVDGAFVYLPRNAVVERPILIELQATTPASVSFPHLTIVAEANAEAAIVIDQRSPDGVRHLMVPQVEASVRDGARLRLVTLQQVGDHGVNLVQERVVVGREATARIGEVGLGGDLARFHLTVDLMGTGGEAEVAGIYFGDHEQVLDYRLFVNHIAPRTSSDVFLKGAVEERARSVFTGLAKIWKDAAKSAAFETNRNLVLSDGAQAHSVPNLEIECDDVIAGHGSTVGPLEEEHLYYVRSRGLRPDRAARLLVRGFFAEAIARLPVPGLADAVRDAVDTKFVKAQEEGRL